MIADIKNFCALNPPKPGGFARFRRPFMGGEEAPPTEQERVESWRFDALVRAGYPTGAAAALAAKPDVDLHRAVAMLEHGCDTLVALDILL